MHLTVPDGMYGNFAGRDASRGMAKQSFDLGIYTTNIVCISPTDHHVLVRSQKCSPP